MAIPACLAGWAAKWLDTRNLERANDLIREMKLERVPHLALEESGPRFIADLRSRGLSEDTIIKFERLKKELETFFPGATLRSISSDDLVEFRGKLECEAHCGRSNGNPFLPY